MNDKKFINNRKEIRDKIIKDYEISKYRIGLKPTLKVAVKELLFILKIRLKLWLIVFKWKLRYYLYFNWYLNYIAKKKLSFKKMNKFEDWVYYKFIAQDFHDYVERVT